MWAFKSGVVSTAALLDDNAELVKFFLSWLNQQILPPSNFLPIICAVGYYSYTLIVGGEMHF